jgi:PelA/Pel-15E family pectate lyase
MNVQAKSWTSWICVVLVGLGVVIEAEAAKTSRPDKETIRIAENILLYQRSNGGWPKNYERDRKLDDNDRKKLVSDKTKNDSTFDNSATHWELRYLAKIITKTKSGRYQKAFDAGLAFTLKAQYANGGWPQFYPDTGGYRKHITFNDGAMIGVMTMLRDIGQGADPYSFVDAETRARCRTAVEKGIMCVVKCQIVVDGKKTAWCAQHDLKTLVPVKARSYELATTSGSESVGIIRFLMQIDKPTSQIRSSIDGAVQWFESAKIKGIKQVKQKDPKAPKGWDRVVVKDSDAPPMWARFYDLKTNQPIFCSRDGIPRRNLGEISYERRNGYSWLGYWGADLLSRDYPAWKRKHAKSK